MNRRCNPLVAARRIGRCGRGVYRSLIPAETTPGRLGFGVERYESGGAARSRFNKANSLPFVNLSYAPPE